MASPYAAQSAIRNPQSAIRVVFLGTPGFAVPALRALIADPAVAVALVVTQPDRPAGRGRQLTPPPVKVLAEAQGLPVFQPERLRGAEVLERLRAADADLFAIAAYGQLLRQAVLDIPRHGTLNVHPSLLPRHRGPAPIPAAILAGDEETGMTIMLTDRGMDTGPILAQERFPLGRHETTASLTPRLAELGADLLVRTIPAWIGGAITPQAQDESAATVSRTFTRADGALDWSRPALELERQVRALYPWPRAYTFDRGKRLLVLNARAIEIERQVEKRVRPLDLSGLNPGAALQDEDGHLWQITDRKKYYGQPLDMVCSSDFDIRTAQAGTIVVDVRDDAPIVVTGSGLLRLLEVQPEGRRPQAGKDFLRGNPDVAGSRWE